MNTAVMVIEPPSKPLVPAKIVEMGTWGTILSVAPAIHKSRMFNVSSPEAAASIMLKGWELGLSLTTSFEFIQVVEGRPGISPRGALALVHQSGELAEWSIEETPDYCEVYMKRRSGFSYRTRWTMDDAKNAGVVKPASNWVKYPANMMRWRCIGYVIDMVFPDIVNGMKRTDELGADLTPDGDTIQAEFTVMPTMPSLPVVAPSCEPVIASTDEATRVTLDALIKTFGAEKIIEANGGLIPGTEEEVLALGAKLAAA